jgi:phage major head subunit gpT-like protein
MANNTLKQLVDLDLDIRTQFQVRFEEVEKNETWFPRLSSGVTTNKLVLTQEWIHDHAQITETDFGQPPTYHEMQGEYTQIPLKIYDDALQVSAYDLAEDNTGLISQRASDLGMRAAKHPQDLAAVALANGDTSDDYLIYDGQRFFANAHPKPDGSTFDNLLAGAFDSANYQIGRTAMQRFYSDLGSTDPYGVKPNFVIAPPDIEVDVLEVLRNTEVSSSSAAIGNVLQGTATPIIESRLTDTNDWYLATTELGIMPFLDIRHTEFGRFDLHSEVSNDDPAFRDHHARRWWLRAVLRVFFTRPETMIKFVNA